MRRRGPETIEFLRIKLVLAEQGFTEPCADHVKGDQYGNAQAEKELQRLDRDPRELPALVQRPDAEAAVHEHGGVEDDRHREELPEQNMVVDAVGQRIDRDVAERM